MGVNVVFTNHFNSEKSFPDYKSELYSLDRK